MLQKVRDCAVGVECGVGTVEDVWKLSHAMLPALLAIRGHMSAHSLATGPVMAEPIVNQTRISKTNVNQGTKTVNF